MSPTELKKNLIALIESNIKHAVMIWGKPGIGKSSIVNQLSKDYQLKFIDLRLSQLMPSDLRGLPSLQDDITHWCPPSFLPDTGKGVLFMDEINMAPPAMQGVAQQLILDRRVGDYVLPEGWFIWAAGNRNSDKAAVYEMPAPLSNRFIHFNVDTSIDDFKQYAFQNNLASDIIGFLSYRPDLLHKVHPSEPNWPSPRTWEIAANLYKAGMSVEPAVGAAATIEFDAFCQLKNKMPDIEAIFLGSGQKTFPVDPSICYATISTLVNRIENSTQAVNSFQWLIQVADEEWIHLFATDLFPRLRETNQFKDFSKSVVQDIQARSFLKEFAELV